MVLQYIPKMYCPISKAVLYIDPESYFPYYAEFYDKKGVLFRFDVTIWSVDNDGLIHPGNIFVADVQRIHATNCYIYDTRNNLDADHIHPGFFSMEYLRSYFGGR